MRFWNFSNTSGDVVKLRIEGDIVDNESAWLYEWFDDLHTSPNAFRQELEQHEGKELHVYVDSYGGSVFAGAGLYSAIKERKGKTIGIVHSKAMSAGTMPLMACDKVLMSPVANLMIHDPITSLHGDLAEFEQTVEALTTIKESIVNAYELKTDLSRKEISELMSNETYMDAEKAVSLGFADRIIDDGSEITNTFPADVTNKTTVASVQKYLELKNQHQKQETDSELEIMSLWLETV